MKPIHWISIYLSALAVCFLIGCATVAPGSDPLVVRTEQTETVAAASFNAIITVDDSNRAFWITNAPAFHNFCEYLRTPVTLHDSPYGSNTYPRGIAFIKQVDDAKLAYKSDVTTSNVLIIALNTLSAAEQQATAWTTIVNAK